MTSLAALVLLAAPAPPADAEARLAALRACLPAVVEAWGKERLPEHVVAVLRRVRMTADREAKAVVFLHSRAGDGSVRPQAFRVLTVQLTFHGGLWSAVRFEWSGGEDSGYKEAAHFLLDAIDEAAAGLLAGDAEEEVAGVVLAQRVVKDVGGEGGLAAGLAAAGEVLLDQAGDGGGVAEGAPERRGS